MRPYWAIIKDSFRAALASRVLYVLLGLITVLLLALAPLHVRETLDWKLDLEQHITSPETLVRRLANGRDDPDRPDIAHIWDSLPKRLQTQLDDIANERDAVSEDDSVQATNQRVSVYLELTRELNELIKDEDFYRAEDWESRAQLTEAEELIELGADTLSEERSRRLNRLLIANALSPSIKSGNATSLTYFYATWEMFSSNTTQQQFANGVTTGVPWFFDKFVLSFGLLIAILVTANIIPETFEAGSLNLLLSKPVSRWALFIAKFIGGCAFVALCAVYLFLGTWLWMGFGLGVWDVAFLYSIPLYILVFAIYYSVSAFIGLSYRSAIMAIIVTGLFWAVCYGVGVGYYRLHTRAENLSVIDVIPVNDEILGVTNLGTPVMLGSDDEWEPAFDLEMREEEQMGLNIAMYMGELREEPFRMPPIVDAQSNVVVTGVDRLLDPFAKNHQDCYVADSEKLDFFKAGKFPRDAMRMFDAKDGPIIVNDSGKFFRLKSDGLKEVVAKLAGTAALTKAQDDAKDATKGAATDDAKGAATDDAKGAATDGDQEDAETNSASESIDDGAPAEPVEVTSTDKKTKKKPQPAASELTFDRIGPGRAVQVNGTGNVAFNYTTEEIAIYNRGDLVIFQPDVDGQYNWSRSLEIDTGTDKIMSAKIAFGGNIVMVVLGNGQVVTVDSTKMAEQNGYTPEARFAIEHVASSRDGRWFGLQFKNDKVWLLDAQDDSQIRLANIRGQGGVSSFSFDFQNQLWVVDRTDRVTRYVPDTMSVEEVHSPGGDWIDYAYRYAVEPFYRICPKPGEFYKVVTYLSDSRDAENNRDVDLSRAAVPTDPWSPLWSGLGFMAMTLLFSCVYFHWKDY